MLVDLYVIALLMFWFSALSLTYFVLRVGILPFLAFLLICFVLLLSFLFLFNLI